jgi:hypothetical protein
MDQDQYRADSIYRINSYLHNANLNCQETQMSEAVEHDNENEYLSAKEVAARWGNNVAATTLAQWRSRKVGPVWTKLGGKVLYSLRDVVAYETAQRRSVR